MLSTLWHTLFFNPFLNILLLLYVVTGQNLGFAVIILAIIVRLALIGSTRKQMEMTTKMAAMKPKLDKIQEKYKHNQEKLAAEQMKLYKESGYNPIGCLGTFVPQILILAAIFGVIRTISNGDFSGLYEPVYNLVFDGGEEVLQNLTFLYWDLTKSFNSFDGQSIFSDDRIPYIALALSVGLVQFVSSKFMQKFQAVSRPKPKKTDKDEPMSQEEMQQQMARSMTTILPLMTAYITLSQPAVLGIYWFAQSVMFVVQYFIIDREKSTKILEEMLPSQIGSLLGIQSEETATK